MQMKVMCIACAILVTGCATHPTDPSGRPLTLDDAGPAPVSAQASFQRAVGEHLKDADSAKFRNISTPTRQIVRAVMGITPGGAGWAMCGEVNAKNSYGGYTGYQWWWVLLNQDRTVQIYDHSMASVICAK